MQLAHIKSFVDNTGSLGITQATVEINPTIMHVLSRDLYQRPIEAVLRETVTNALDSHVEAGTEHIPIDIKLPTIFSEEFYIRDYGTGLSLERVKELYLSYGASTRRESNEYTGAFGLGCKASLAYTSAFSVTSYFEGKKYDFLVYYDQDNLPCLDHRNTEDTDEPNGLKIAFTTLQTNDYIKFQTAASVILCRIPKEKFRIISEDSLAYNNKEYSLPEGEEYGAMVLRKKVSYINGTIKIIIGYVAYSIDVNEYINILRNNTVFSNNNAWVFDLHGSNVEITPEQAITNLLRSYDIEITTQMGEYPIHPSRENIVLTARTINNLNRDLKKGLTLYLNGNVRTSRLLTDLFLFDTARVQPQENNFFVKIFSPYDDNHPEFFRVSSYYTKNDHHFFTAFSSIVNTGLKYSIYKLGLPKEKVQLLANALVKEGRLGVFTPFFSNRIVLLYAVDVNKEFSNHIFEGLPEIDVKEIETILPEKVETTRVVPLRVSTKSIQDKAHNILILRSSSGTFKSNWQSAQHTAKSLQELKKPIFWVSTKNGCVRDSDYIKILYEYSWVKPVIPERYRPIIIGLPATKGTKTIEKAFPHITELRSYIEKMLARDYFQRRYKLYATYDFIHDRAKNTISMNFFTIRHWRPADTIHRLSEIFNRYSLANYFCINRYLNIKDKASYIYPSILDMFDRVSVVFPQVVSGYLYRSDKDKVIAWAKSVADLLDEKPTSAIYKNRGY